MEGTFIHICQLLASHGMVPNEIHDAEEEWNKYNLAQQRVIYRSIRDKIRQGKFVNYHPALAIRANAPKKRPPQRLSFRDYYAHFHTTVEQPGWRMVTPKTGNVYYEHV